MQTISHIDRGRGNSSQPISRMYLIGLFVCTILPLFFSCSEAREHTADAINPKDSVAMMTSYGVNTLISDSGVIKYRIVTEQWDVNTTRQPSRWEFMKGIFFEQFDEKFQVQSYIEADTAWYFDQQRLWKLRGRVRFRNTDGLVFTSEELYWDGMTHEFYSNVYSRLVTPERTLHGTYFRSNESMTRYTVTNSKGSFIAEDLEDDQQEKNNSTAVSGNSSSDNQVDTTSVTPTVRPAHQKHAANK